MIDSTIEADVVPLGDKPVLKRDCGRWEKALLESGYSCVLVIWDLLGDWGEYEKKGCRHDVGTPGRNVLRFQKLAASFN